MGTLVVFHAHPDDEAITTGGSIARAADEGHRVVLVVATDGAHGECPDDLAEGETLVDRRRAELQRSAETLGVHRVVWLGYCDSGMTGWEQNADPGCFHQAPIDEAAARLAAVLTEERADVFVTYDWHGNYGHPDHIQVHRVGHRAAELAGVPAVFEATMNRDHIVRLMQQGRQAAQAAKVAVAEASEHDASAGDSAGEAAGETAGETAGGGIDDFDPTAPADDGNPFGMSESELTHFVDVSPWIDRKRRSIACHASQVTDAGFFLRMPEDQFRMAFGTEWFIRKGATHAMREGWLFE